MALCVQKPTVKVSVEKYEIPTGPDEMEEREDITEGYGQGYMLVRVGDSLAEEISQSVSLPGAEGKWVHGMKSKYWEYILSLSKECRYVICVGIRQGVYLAQGKNRVRQNRRDAEIGGFQDLVEIASRRLSIIDQRLPAGNPESSDVEEMSDRAGEGSGEEFP